MKKLFAALLLALTSSVFAATLTPIQLLNPAGSTSGQVIRSTGPSTAPAWGNVTAANLATQAANTVLANVTGSTASPTAVALPSCSTSTSALQYTSGTGFGCFTSMAVTTGTLGQFSSTTSAQLAAVLTDETGTGSVVYGTSPTITTPTINGITSGTNGAAGALGQCISSTVASGSAVALTANTGTNVTSISLTAGDWLVFGQVNFQATSTTTVAYTLGSINSVSATPTNANLAAMGGVNGSVLQTSAVGVPIQRVNITSTSTYYLVAQASFGTSTLSAYGSITACRWH